MIITNNEQNDNYNSFNKSNIDNLAFAYLRCVKYILKLYLKRLILMVFSYSLGFFVLRDQ